MRINGAKNKSKYIKVKISDLNNVFKPEAEIEISMAYAILFPGAISLARDSDDNESDEQKVTPLEFTVS